MVDRESALNRVLVHFASDLCTDFSVQSILDHLVASAVELLPISGAGVMVVDAGDELHFLASTDDVVRRIETLQRETGEGPCLQAHRSGRPCILDDLSTGDAFPEFSRRALDVGIAAVFSFPLHAAGRNLGALDLYRSTPGPLNVDDVRIVKVLADVAAAYLVNARSRADTSFLLAELNHRSLHDALTGLPNRTLLAELLTEALNRALRSRRRIAVLFIDLDQFKSVNDQLGHHVGDQLLIAVAARLTAALRPGDTLARLGGDEFVAVCEDLPDGSRAADVAHRLLGAMTNPFHIGGQDVELGTSIGIALSDRREPVPAEQLMATADAAMYEAKRAGGRQHFIRYAAPADPEPTPPNPRSVTGPSAISRIRPGRRHLESAAEEDRFAAVYQPILGLREQTVVAVEALLRWGPNTADTTPPATIITEAERSGAILGLGDWILRRACRDSVRWRRGAGDGARTSVNVSAQQVIAPAFVRTLEKALSESGLDPASLCLELTESSALPEDRRTVDTLRTVKQLGLQLWLDDFGSGYSSLNYLRLFPFDAVKIDPSFAQRLTSDEPSRAIISSTTALCHELGMRVIVEGIENAAELRAAADLGADAVQGYHIGRPLPADETTVLLDQEPREASTRNTSTRNTSTRNSSTRNSQGTPAVSSDASVGARAAPRRPSRSTKPVPVPTIESLLRSGDLRTVFQPIVDLDSSTVVAHEALTRGPEGDWADPLSLFSSARVEGLLSELDHGCRRAAVLEALRQRRTATTLFLNAEPEAFQTFPTSNAWSALNDLITSSPLDLDVVLEITERDIPTRPAALLRTIDRVRELGWRIALDDVGASTASLAFMPLLRPDVVKLDTALVQGRPTPEAAQIVHAVNDYAERTGALVLAEGIENTLHLHTARALGAHLGQGFLFGRPSERIVPDRSSPATGDPASTRTGSGRPQRTERAQVLVSVPPSKTGEPQADPSAATPFATLPSELPLRRASKTLLLQLSTQLEEQAARSGQTCVLASAFQHARHFTPTTARRYAAVAENAGFVYAVGEAFTSTEVPGVHVASVPADDPLCREWDVAVIGPHFHAALLARELEPDPVHQERVFEYVVTYRYDTVVAAVRDLLLRVAGNETAAAADVPTRLTG